MRSAHRSLEASAHAGGRAGKKMTDPRENGGAGRSLLLEGWRQDLHRQSLQPTLGPAGTGFAVTPESPANTLICASEKAEIASRTAWTTAWTRPRAAAL